MGKEQKGVIKGYATELPKSLTQHLGPDGDVGAAKVEIGKLTDAAPHMAHAHATRPQKKTDADIVGKWEEVTDVSSDHFVLRGNVGDFSSKFVENLQHYFTQNGVFWEMQYQENPVCAFIHVHSANREALAKLFSDKKTKAIILKEPREIHKIVKNLTWGTFTKGNQKGAVTFLTSLPYAEKELLLNELQKAGIKTATLTTASQTGEPQLRVDQSEQARLDKALRDIKVPEKKQGLSLFQRFTR